MKIKPPTPAEFDRAKMAHYRPGVRVDLRSIDSWIDGNLDAWPDEVQKQAKDLKLSVQALAQLLDDGKPDALIAHHHHELWAGANRIKGMLNEPDIERGKKVMVSAKTGHEMVHGTMAQKMSGWHVLYNDWQAEKAKGTRNSAQVVADRHGVAKRTVERTLKYLKKN